MDQNNQPQSNTETPPPVPQLPTEPEPSTQAYTPQPAPKPRRKGLKIAIIIAAIFVVLAGGVAAGYFLWYQNPEKVVADGLVNAIKAKSVTYTGEMSVRSGENSSFRLELIGKNKIGAGELNAKATIVSEGKETVVEGDALMVEMGDLYVRFHEVDKLIEQLSLGEFDSQLGETVNAFISKVNGQWVKISAEDLKQFDQSAGEMQQCMAGVYQRIESDDTIMAEVADVYKNNKFILVAESLGSHDGSMGYRLELDEVKLKDFTTALDDTELYRQLRECNDSVEAAKDIEFNDDNTRTEVWVNQWTHAITKFKVEPIQRGDEDYSAELLPQFNQDVTVTAPESSLSLEELRAEIQALMEESQRATMEGYRNNQRAEPTASSNQTT